MKNDSPVETIIANARKAFGRLPEKLGEVADKLYEIRAVRADVARAVKELEALETAMENHLIDKVDADAAEGIVGTLATVRITRKVVPTVESWEDLTKYILKTKDLSFLQRRVNTKRVAEVWEESKKVPGVQPFNVKSVSVTKR